MSGTASPSPPTLPPSAGTMTPTVRQCRYCCSEIARAAVVCSHCSRHQWLLLQYLDRVGLLVSIVMMLVALASLREAATERFEAEQAHRSAQEAARRVQQVGISVLDSSLAVTLLGLHVARAKASDSVDPDQAMMASRLVDYLRLTLDGMLSRVGVGIDQRADSMKFVNSFMRWSEATPGSPEQSAARRDVEAILAKRSASNDSNTYTSMPPTVDEQPKMSPGSVNLRWAEVVTGFVLGLTSGWLLEAIRDHKKAKRMKAALIVELARIRDQCVGFLWTAAEMNGRLTPHLAGLMVEILDRDPFVRARLSQEQIAYMRIMLDSQEACDAENARHTERGLSVAPPLAMPVFSAQPEVLGYLPSEAARAVVDAYYGIPGINRICEDLQDYCTQRPRLGSAERADLDVHHAQVVLMLESYSNDLRERCDLALAVLSGSKTTARDSQ